MASTSDETGCFETTELSLMLAFSERGRSVDHTCADPTLSSSRESTRIRPLESSFVNDQKYSWDKEIVMSNRRRLIRRLLWGGFAGGFVALCSVILIKEANPGLLQDMFTSCRGNSVNDKMGTCNASYPSPSLPFLRLKRQTGITSYLNLFGGTKDEGEDLKEAQFDSSGMSKDRHRRTLSGSMERGAQLVIAGKMTVEEGPCNIAQFNLRTDTWSLTERIQLSLYNSYSGGEVYSLLANHSVSYANDPEGGRYVFP